MAAACRALPADSATAALALEARLAAAEAALAATAAEACRARRVASAGAAAASAADLPAAAEDLAAVAASAEAELPAAAEEAEAVVPVVVVAAAAEFWSFPSGPSLARVWGRAFFLLRLTVYIITIIGSER